MGWNGGHFVAAELIATLLEEVENEDVRFLIYKDLIVILEAQDWDSGDFDDDDDPVFVRAMREIHPDWEYTIDDSVKTKPCIMCGDQLEPIRDSWDTMQPNDGGEVQFLFSYGSTKFDNCMGTTVFKGVICDNCAEKLVDNMEEVKS